MTPEEIAREIADIDKEGETRCCDCRYRHICATAEPDSTDFVHCGTQHRLERQDYIMTVSSPEMLAEIQKGNARVHMALKAAKERGKE
jgi:hypothetical protein